MVLIPTDPRRKPKVRAVVEAAVGAVPADQPHMATFFQCIFSSIVFGQYNIPAALDA